MNAEITKRTGLLAKKLGMTQIFDAEGNAIAVTLLKADDNYVVANKTEKKDGYNAVVIGFDKSKVSRINKPQREFFSKNKFVPTKNVKEFRVSEDALIKPGSKLSIEHFVLGQSVDITSKSIGKGFAGGMKRHNFAGLEATHGVSVSHRSHGSTGQCQDPGRVFKGKKMAGHLGDEKVTMQSVQIVSIDKELGVIAVNGSVPGKPGNIIEIKDAVKLAIPFEAPFPAAILEEKPSKNKEDKAVDAAVNVNEGKSDES